MSRAGRPLQYFNVPTGEKPTPLSCSYVQYVKEIRQPLALVFVIVLVSLERTELDKRHAFSSALDTDQRPSYHIFVLRIQVSSDMSELRSGDSTESAEAPKSAKSSTSRPETTIQEMMISTPIEIR